MGLKDEDVPDDVAPVKQRRPKSSTELSTKLSASIGVFAAVALSIVVNVLVVRHYHRWDLTRGGVFTLSEGTTQTLHALPEPITVVVLLSNGDPLQTSVEQILDAYKSETTQLKIEYVDPDRKPAEFLAIQQKYDLSTGRADDGRLVAETAIVVARGDRHHFVTSSDLVEVDDADDMRARPRLEQAITGAIRSVLDDTKPKVCITTGHGEHSVEEGGDTGLAYLRDRLVKNNFEVASVFADDTAVEPLADCNLVILAAPTTPLPKEHADALRRYVETGGNALLVAGPVPGEDGGYVDLGVGDVFALAGVELMRPVIFERDASHRYAQGHGEIFYPDLQTHPITAGLEHEKDKGTRVLVNVATGLRDAGNGVKPSVLLSTTNQAIGLTDFARWARNPGFPDKADDDLAGPFPLAIAAERPKRNATDERGGRIVALSCPTLLSGMNWREPGLRGNALLVESAISWLSSHRAFLDIPNRPSVTMGVRLTEQGLRAIFVFVVGIIPAITGAVGVYLFLQRRKRPAKKTAGAA